MGRALLALLAFLGAVNDAPAQQRRPNILFILADDLGYGDLGCYGQKKIRTPNLDRLAAQGLRFTQAYAGSTVCAPSRCALLTGRHTGHAFIRGNRETPPEGQEPIPANTTTIARLLQKTGYVTGLIGKWGLGGPNSSGVPTLQGFDSFFGYLCQKKAHEYYPAYLWRNTEKVPLGGKTYSHDLFTDEALQFVRKHEDVPFFLDLSFTIPHAKLQVPSDAPYTNEPWPQAQKNHAAMIGRLDRDVGRLLDLLHELGLDEHTIVFFSSDNGPHAEGGADPAFFRSSGPLRGFKRSLHEGGVRVPMLVRWTGHVPAGKVSDQVWAFWDFFPTATELAGAAVPSDLDGISMVPTFLGKEGQKQHAFLYWEFHEKGTQQAVRMGDWKAVRPKLGDALELYDLRRDLGEEHDAAAQHPDVVARIEAYLRTARTASTLWPLLPGKR